MKATKKPVEIEYYPLEEKYIKEILKWSNKKRPIVIVSDENAINGISYAEITTLEGVMKAEGDDIIIKGVNGEVYPCRKEIFEKTYQLNKQQ